MGLVRMFRTSQDCSPAVVHIWQSCLPYMSLQSCCQGRVNSPEPPLPLCWLPSYQLGPRPASSSQDGTARSQPCTASSQPHLKQGCCQLGGMLRQQVRPLLCQGHHAPRCGPLLAPLCAGQACRATKRIPVKRPHVSCGKACACLEHAPVSTAGSGAHCEYL